MTSGCLTPYAACFRAGLKEAFANRSSLATTLLVYVTLMVLFQNIFRIFPVDELNLEGLVWEHLLWYFAVTEMIVVSVQGNERLLARQIAEDGLAAHMARPGSMLGRFMAQGAGSVAANMCVIFLCAVLLLPLLTGGRPQMTFMEMPVFFLSVFLGMAIIMLLGYCISTVEIHGPYSRPFAWIISKLIFTFGGLFFPVLFFPEWLKTVLLFTPFPSTIGAAGSMMLPTPASANIEALFQQILWVCVTFLLTLHCQKRLFQKVMRDGD